MAGIQLKPYPKLEEAGMKVYLDYNFQALQTKINELEERIIALEAGP